MLKAIYLKTSFYCFYSLLFFFLCIPTHAIAASVTVTVNWPQFATENGVQIYNVSNTTPVTANFTVSTTPYSGSQTYTLSDATTYTLRMTDTYGDGWNGAGASVTVTSGGSTLLSTTLSTGSSSVGQFTTPSISGSGAETCDAVANTSLVLGGSATRNASNEITLTPNMGNQSGSAWSNQVISLVNPFNLKFRVNLGSNDAAGADGMAFAFHRAPQGPNAVGYFGGALGVGGLSPAIAIEFDTFDNTAWGEPGFEDIAGDHTVVYNPASYTNAAGGGSGSLISPVINLGNIEDNNWHTAEVAWTPATNTLSYKLDGTTVYSTTRDIINIDFGGYPYVYYGFAAGTGAYYNQQSACIITTPAAVPNAPPVIMSNGGGASASISVVENQTAVTTVTATDVNTTALTYSITGGADAAKFAINASTGVLTFVIAPDYEAPTDGGANNVYDVQVTVSDGKGGTDVQAIAVTVTDVVEGGGSGSVPIIGGSTSCTASGGTDVLFLLDNSGSIDSSEYSTYASTVVSVGNALRAANSATRIAVAHYAGSYGGSDFGQNVYFERNFSTSTLTSPMRQFASGGAYDTNLAMDNMAGAVYQMSYGLDGNSSTTSSYIVGSLKELSRDLARPLQVVIFTDANREFYGASALIDGSGYAYEPNDGSNFTIYNKLKTQGVKFSVVALSIDNPQVETEEVRNAAAAAIASTGGSWTGTVESNPSDPEGSQSSPRRFETTTNFTLTSTQISNFVNPTANVCPATPTNAAPVITSNGGGASASISVAENQTAVTTVTATDANGDTLSYSITGGTDAAKFAINASTGVLTFVIAPDYEAPTDGGANNVYDVQVTVSDGKGGTDVQAIAVTVTDVNENVAPVITSNGGGASASISVAENQTAVTTVTATDANAGDVLLYGITGGADAWKFAMNSNTGVLTFVAAPDYETPTDTGANNIYDVQVTVWDGNGGTDVQAIAVTVTDVNENVAPVITSNGGGASASISVAENQTAVTTVTATDANGDTLSYSITGGTDAAKFAINASTGVLTFVIAPDYEAPTDGGANNVYDVQVTVSDGQGGMDMQDIVVTVTNATEGVVLNIKGFLQGAFNTNTGVMSDSLRVLNIIPNNQPYTSSPFNYTGIEQVNTVLFATIGNDAIVDWVLVELRNVSTPATIVARQAALLQRDGDVVSADAGSVNITFSGISAGSYYVSLRHRNHLGVMTANSVSLSSLPTLVDFTKASTATYGSNAQLVIGSQAVMWSGDANKNNLVIANGPSNDINEILGSILIAPENTLFNSNYILSGYNSSDVNLDGVTVFAGPNNDTNLVIGNVLLHPNNGTFSANFVIQGTLPK